MTQRGEIVFTHSEVEGDEITAAEIEELHEIFVDILFQEWLREKGFQVKP